MRFFFFFLCTIQQQRTSQITLYGIKRSIYHKHVLFPRTDFKNIKKKSLNRLGQGYPSMMFLLSANRVCYIFANYI